jgi:broad specificity phosphatase PhoE
VTARIALVVCLLFSPGLAFAQQSLLIVRHAERQTGQGDDGLSEAGRQRAARLAAVLANAGITHIFVSDRKRTSETAEPLARARGLRPIVIPMPAEDGKRDPADRQVRSTLVATRKLPPAAVVLVVGHSNTVPVFLRRLGYAMPINIPDTEFDNLFVVTPRPTRPPAVVRIRY